MALGRKTGGRKKGSKNKVTAEARVVLDAIVNKRLKDLDEMIEDTWRGIEIEKTVIGPDGKPQTMLGRLNADAGRAAKLVLEAYKLIHPPPLEITGKDGGPLRHVFRIEEGA